MGLTCYPVSGKELYVLIDPRDGRVRYAGATAYRLAKRLQMHVTLSRRNTSRSAAWIRELADADLRPIIETRGIVIEWQHAEQDLIAALRADSADLLNMADGGLGVRGCRPNDETRQKRSRTLKKRYADDPKQMEARRELARQAGRSEAARRSASERMTKRWAALREARC